MVRIVVAEAVDLSKDYVFVMDLPSKPNLAVLSYDVSGPWGTGLAKIIVNGVVVKDYTGLFSTGFQGSEQVDIAQFLFSGYNRIYFEGRVQLIAPFIGATLNAYLDIDVNPSSTNVEKTGEGIQLNSIIILIVLLLVVLVIFR
ncbi:MAG: hypothetical protein QXO75_03435 [Nitrososphaerota archaeon]